jgi:hypothetical protein
MRFSTGCKRKAPNNLFQSDVTVTNKSTCKALSSSDTHKNSFHLEKQPTNAKLIKNSKNRLCAEKVIKQSGAGWARGAMILKMPLKPVIICCALTLHRQAALLLLTAPIEPFADRPNRATL